MSPFFIIIGIVTLLGAVFAMSLRNLVHCALAMAVAFLRCRGALSAARRAVCRLCRNSGLCRCHRRPDCICDFAHAQRRDPGEKRPDLRLVERGIAVTAMVFTMLGWAILNSSAVPQALPAAPSATVKKIGDALMTKFVLPLEIIGLVLTAAMIGGVIIALKEDSQKSKSEDGGQQ